MRQLFNFFHKHKWQISGTAIFGIGYMTNDCDKVPLSCKCGATALGKWRIDNGMVEIRRTNG